jgi:hypothetical protein
VRRADNLTTFKCRMSWNLRASTSWNHQGLSKPVQGLLYVFTVLKTGSVIVRFEVLTALLSGFGGLEVACWPLIPKFAGSHPAEAVRIFRAKKILSTPSFRGEVKPSVSCRSFMACKRSLNVTWKLAFRQNYRTFFAHSSTFRRWVLSHGDTHGDACVQKLECLTKIAQ